MPSFFPQELSLALIGIMQLTIFPRVAKTWLPLSRPSAAALWVARTDNGRDYVLKDDVNGVPIRAVEWICHCLAKDAGIPVPIVEPVMLPTTGKLLFGSQWAGGLVNDDVRRRIFSGENPVEDISAMLSSVYAFDLFVSNNDRHLENWLVQNVDGRNFLLAFDFSHALFNPWPPSPLPFQPCNTTYLVKNWVATFGFEHEASNATLDALEKIKLQRLEEIMAAMPRDWLDKSSRKGLTDWWGKHRISRIAGIRGGLKNGTML